MDRVRFGRALGIGARHAAKALVSAADAATSDNPRAPTTSPPSTTESPRPRTGRAEPLPPRARTSSPVSNPVVKATQAATRAASQARDAHRGVKRGSQRFGQAVWSPFVRLSGVLWLEVTGVFFGILAAFAAQGAWKARAELYSGSGSHQHLIGALAMLAVFGYFCVSSFLRAGRRQRGR